MYYFKLIIAFLNKFKFIISIGIVFGIFSFYLFNNFIYKNYLGKTTTIGILGRYRPNDLPLYILNKISRGLTKVKDGNLEPDLAEYWETTDKGKTWIFKLKDNIYWHDGTKISSNDIILEFSGVSIEKPNDNTIKFILDEPYSPFPYIVSKPIFKKGLMGTGDWKVKNIKIVNTYISYLMLKNSEGNTLIYKFYPSSDLLKHAYKMGKIDQIKNISDPSPFNNWNNSKIIKNLNYSQIVTLFFNTQDKILSEKIIRQSLNYAIDKESFGNRAYTPLNPESWAYNPQVKSYDFNIDNSLNLLKEIPKEIKDNLEITLITTPNLLNIAEKISKDWEKISVKTTIQVSSTKPNEYQCFLTIFDIPNDPDQYPLWHSTKKDTNITKLNNPRIDKLLEDGRVELDIEKRRKIYLDFQKYLLEELPAIFLYHPVYYDIIRK